MTPHFIVGKLMMIEEDPFKIWKALEDNYGVGYFRKVVERVMGVTDAWKDEIKTEFREKIHQTRFENEKMLN